MNGLILNIQKLLQPLFLLLVALTGCADNKKVATIDRICIPSIDQKIAMEKSEKVLEKMYFKIEKSDAQQGIIKTRPLRGAQFFEFWRKDNVGKSNTSEANMQDLRRIAQLDIADSNSQLCINCTVQVSRLNMPTHVGSSAQAYRMFSKSGKSTQKLELYPDQIKNITWTDLGRDNRLETRILEKIKKELTLNKP